MIYTHEVQQMCCVKKGANHPSAPIPEEGKWVRTKEIKDINGLTHGIGWCAPQQGACKLTLNVKDGIIQEALAYQIEIIDVADVDRFNVYQASKKGMIDAIDHLSIRPDYALTDAMPLGDVIEHQAIVKGDAKSLSIGAASILAKVTRDHIMNDYAKIYPEYGFEKHKGYPTKQHKEALKAYGVTPIHRRSFQPVIDVLNQQMSLFDDENMD